MNKKKYTLPTVIELTAYIDSDKRGFSTTQYGRSYQLPYQTIAHSPAYSGMTSTHSATIPITIPDHRNTFTSIQWNDINPFGYSK